MSDEKDVVNAKAVGVKKDSMIIFKLVLEGYGEVGEEKAKDLGLIEAGYEYGEWDNYIPVIEGKSKEPEKTRGFINSNQPIRGELKL